MVDTPNTIPTQLSPVWGENADRSPSNRKRIVKLTAKITRVDGRVEHRDLIDLTKES